MFKDILRQLRTERNLTQAEIAEAIGVSAATIGNYEQGTREPRKKEIWQKLSDYFGVSIDSLMDKSYVSTNDQKPPLKESESIKRNYFKQIRSDIPIVYNGINITPLVIPNPGESISVTTEQRYAYIEFNSLSGHAIFARHNLLDILKALKQAAIDDISKNLTDITKRIDHDVIYWYKKCWNNIDDIFPEVTDLETLYDLIDKCLCVDMIAAEEFYLEAIQENYDWLRYKLH